MSRMPNHEPTGEPLSFPRGYGTATKPMAWSEVDRLLTGSRVYWIATGRADGRPHVVPSDGIWLDAALYFGGDPDTVHMRNVRRSGHAVAHVGDGMTAAVIVEGMAADETPTRTLAARLVEANRTKYPDYGLATTANEYIEAGVTALHADRVLAWTRFPENATRFRF
jgi:hypothetical protein